MRKENKLSWYEQTLLKLLKTKSLEEISEESKISYNDLAQTKESLEEKLEIVNFELKKQYVQGSIDFINLVLDDAQEICGETNLTTNKENETITYEYNFKITIPNKKIE